MSINNHSCLHSTIHTNTSFLNQASCPHVLGKFAVPKLKGDRLWPKWIVRVYELRKHYCELHRHVTQRRGRTIRRAAHPGQAPTSAGKSQARQPSLCGINIFLYTLAPNSPTMSTLREQIAAKRAEARKTATPIKGHTARHVPSDDSLNEERTTSGQIKKAVRSGMSPFHTLC